MDAQATVLGSFLMKPSIQELAMSACERRSTWWSLVEQVVGKLIVNDAMEFILMLSRFKIGSWNSEVEFRLEKHNVFPWGLDATHPRDALPFSAAESLMSRNN
ncbi:hypothetical protein WN943_007223 [Citrus x changshan-huyou]